MSAPERPAVPTWATSTREHEWTVEPDGTRMAVNEREAGRFSAGWVDVAQVVTATGPTVEHTPPTVYLGVPSGDASLTPNQARELAGLLIGAAELVDAIEGER